MSVVISAQTAEFKKGLDNANNKLSGFTSGLTKIGGAIAGAFAIQKVASFGLEISKLAGEAQGVKNAFDKLPGSTQVLKAS